MLAAPFLLLQLMTQSLITSSNDDCSPHPMITSLKAGIVKTNPKYALVTMLGYVSELSNIKEAIAHEGVASSYERRVTGIGGNDTQELVPKTSDMNMIDIKWVFKMKYNVDNSVERLNERLVAKGYNQQEGD